MIFTIDTENNITAHETTPAGQDGLILFATEKALSSATAAWPISRLVDIWNSFAGTPGFDGLKPVKKFENKTKATKRIWEAIQRLLPAAAATNVSDAAKASYAAPAAAKTKKGSKSAAPKSKKASKPAGEPKTPREGSKLELVIKMINRKGGVTLAKMMEETGWQAHTCRGFMSTLTRKTGVEFTSTRRESDKARVYEAVRQ
jgi:predicted ribonuclease toxin of YeeF-YezG toxin-antitoxin module